MLTYRGCHPFAGVLKFFVCYIFISRSRHSILQYIIIVCGGQFIWTGLLMVNLCGSVCLGWFVGGWFVGV